MAILLERTIKHRNKEYRVIADLDDAAMVDDMLLVTIQAAVRELPHGSWFEESLQLVVNVEQSNVKIMRENGKVIATIPLKLPIGDSDNFHGNDIDVSDDDKIIEGAIGKSGIEELIHLIPTDPILGCLAKGAVSTAVGQIIRCWRKASNAGSVSQRARNIGSCLREHSFSMAMTFMYRVGRCIALAGLG